MKDNLMLHGGAIVKAVFLIGVVIYFVRSVNSDVAV